MADIDYEYAHGVACIELAKAKAEIERLRAVSADEQAGLRLEIRELRAEKAGLLEATRSVIAEFEEELTRQQRDYIVDQIARRAFP